MSPRTDRIKDDFQSLKALQNIRTQLQKIQEEIYRYEPTTNRYKTSYAYCQMGLEKLISDTDAVVALISAEIQ